jgi:N-acyl-D-aspartate/D-glutamate deacylase
MSNNRDEREHFKKYRKEWKEIGEKLEELQKSLKTESGRFPEEIGADIAAIMKKMGIDSDKRKVSKMYFDPNDPTKPFKPVN